MPRDQRPSNDLPTLGFQLRSSLAAITDDADGTEARDFRRFLRHTLAKGWRAAATGRFGEVRRVVDIVREARPVVDDALPDLGPRAVAAVELQQTLAALYTGEDELREVELELRLSDRGRNPTERAVLKVLSTAEKPFRQAEVHQQLALGKSRVSASRVGQILRELHEHGYAIRQMARARGRSEVAHYSLASRGFALCEQLGIVTCPSEVTAESEALVASKSPSGNLKVMKTMSELWRQPEVEARPSMQRVLMGFLQPTADARLVQSSLESFGVPRAEVQKQLAELKDFQAVKEGDGLQLAAALG